MTPTPDLSAEVISIFVGSVRDRWPGKPPSAILKTATDATLRLEKDGFTEDRQADRNVHGGPEKAVHHYAADHMAHWRKKHPEKADMFVPGCFGENISTRGLTEGTLCLGDILTMGTAIVQVCQGRQPCWKLSAHTGIPEMALQFQESALTGWYYRVLETGQVRRCDRITLIERRHPEWPLKRLISARFNRNLNVGTAAELASLEVLSESWRKAFLKKTQTGYIENTDARLKG